MKAVMLRSPHGLRRRCSLPGGRATATDSPACGRRLSPISGEGGFSLIEVVVAMVVFVIVSTALGGVLTASIAARSLALDRTKAEQIANKQIEWIRSLDYLQVGLTATGQVRGEIDRTGNQASHNGPTVPAGYAVVIKVSWVDDPTPTSYSHYASYKNVLVTVSRAGDSKEFTHQSTQVGPRTGAAFGGINSGAIEALVVDYYSGGVGPMADVNVTLSTGPSAPLDEDTNANGAVRFRGLTSTPASGATAFYDLDVAASSGWVLVVNPLASHLTLAPGETAGPKTLYVYKPLTLSIPLFNADGTPFTGTATIKVSNTRGSRTLTYSGTPLTVTSIVNTSTGLSEPLVPEPYTVTVLSGLVADSLTVPVPLNYPSDLTVDASITAKVVGVLTTTVTWGGQPVSGATVTLTGGPQSISLSDVTNASGVASFPDVPAGSGYSLSATKSGESGTGSATVVANTTDERDGHPPCRKPARDDHRLRQPAPGCGRQDLRRSHVAARDVAHDERERPGHVHGPAGRLRIHAHGGEVWQHDRDPDGRERRHDDERHAHVAGRQRSGNGHLARRQCFWCGGQPDRRSVRQLDVPDDPRERAGHVHERPGGDRLHADRDEERADGYCKHDRHGRIDDQHRRPDGDGNDRPQRHHPDLGG